MILDLAIGVALVLVLAAGAVGYRRVIAAVESLGLAISARLDASDKRIDAKLDSVRERAELARAASSASFAALEKMNAAALRIGAGAKRPPSPSSPEITGSWKAIAPPEGEE